MKREAAVALPQSADIVSLRSALSGGEGPLYRRLAAAIREAIEAGRIPPGSRLPPERQLADELGVSRMTTVAAYELLREAGQIVRRQGSGTRVAQRPQGADPWAGSVSDQLGHPVLPIDESGSGVDVDGAATAFTIAAMAAMDGLIERTTEFAARELPRLATGHGYAPTGYLPLREAIADRFTARGLPTAPDEVLVTTGAQQAISLLVTLLVGPDGVALVEDPTYPGVLDSIRAAGARAASAPVDASGVRPDLLADQVRRWNPRLIYLVATHHNPTGVTMSDARRREIVELAVRSRTPLVDDLALDGLSLDGSAVPPPLATMDPARLVITIGSLSKLVWGGLRVGWVRGPRSLIDRLVRLKLAQDHGTSLVSQAIAVPLVPELDAYGAARRIQLQERYEAITGALRTHLPDWSWTRPDGGLSLWVRLPAGSTSTLAELATRYGVTIVPGPTFSAAGNHVDRLRLPFGAAPDVLRGGIARLAEAWRDYQPLVDRTPAAPLRLVV